MKIAHVSIDPEFGNHIAIITGEGTQALHGQTLLRCGAYRFMVTSRVRDYPEAATPTVAVRLDCMQHPAAADMVVHLADEPLTDEEFAAAVQHLLMIPRMLLGIDANGVLKRLRDVDGPSNMGIASACNTVEQLAKAVEAALYKLPRLEAATEAQRYASELTKLS